MANRKINELSVRTPSLTDLMIVGDPSTGYSFKATLAALNTLIDSSTSIGDLNGVVITSPTNGQALVYNGTNWVNQSISVPVTSVFGRTGAVVATEGDYSLDLLSDVTLTTPSSNQVLQYNGTAWVNATLTDNGITSLNGLTALSQTFATGSSGTDFAISSTTSTHTFNLPTASAVNRGALSSADWSTFNAKQDAITLTTTGSSGSATLVGATLNIPTYTLSGLGGISGSGTSGQVAYWTGTSSQSGSNNLFWDNANGRLGIGTNTPNGIWSGNNRAIQILSPSNFSSELILSRPVGSTAAASVSTFLSASTNDYGFYTASSLLNFVVYTNNLERFRVNNNGNFLINTITDGGQRLQVTGDVLFKGSGNTSGTTALTVQNSDATNILNIRNDGSIQIGSRAATQRPYFAGYTSYSEFGAAQSTLGIVTQFLTTQRPDPAILIKNSANLDFTSGTSNFLVLQTNYSPTSGTGTFTSFLSSTTINQTGGANGITRGLYVNPTLTAAADWRSVEWSNNSGWGLYGAGTANNYLNGNLGIGNTTPFSGATVNSSVELGAFSANNGNLIVRGYSSLGGLQNNAYGAVGSNYYLDASNALRRKNADLVSTLEFSSGFRFSTAGNGAANSVISLTELMRLNANGNLLLGSTTDGGQKLQVTGNARMTGNLTVSTGGTGTNTLNASTNLLQANTNQFIGVLSITSNSNQTNAISVSASGDIASGIRRILNVTSTLSQSSGTTNAQILELTPTYNLTGTNSNTVWGIRYDPILTSMTGATHIAIQTVSGNVLFGTTSGSVGVGTSTINASAILELSSTTKALLLPRMTGAQAEAIAGVDGLVIYANNGNGTTITSTGFWGYAAGAWVKLN